jgi:hypothetical protein
MCNTVFGNQTMLLKHLEGEKHFGVSKDAPWKDDDKFLLPTFENDPLLQILDTAESDDEKEQPPMHFQRLSINEVEELLRKEKAKQDKEAENQQDVK